MLENAWISSQCSLFIFWSSPWVYFPPSSPLRLCSIMQHAVFLCPWQPSPPPAPLHSPLLLLWSLQGTAVDAPFGLPWAAWAQASSAQEAWELSWYLAQINTPCIYLVIPLQSGATDILFLPQTSSYSFIKSRKSFRTNQWIKEIGAFLVWRKKKTLHCRSASPFCSQ